MPMTFNHPWFLLIWLAIPIVWWVFAKRSQRFSGAKKRVVVSAIRTIIIGLIGLILSDPHLKQASETVNLMVSLDLSSSISQPSLDKARTFILDTASSRKETDRIGMVLFGKEASLERSMGSDPLPINFKSDVNKEHSNIYAGLETALGQFPPDNTNRIVLVSDGNQNIQDAIEMGYLAKSKGVQIVTIPVLTNDNANEVLVERLDTPSTVSSETPFEITLVVRSTDATESDLILLKDGQPIAQEILSLTPGLNKFTLVDTIDGQGLHSYKAVVTAENDTIFQNNQGLSFTKAIQKSGILYLSSSSGPVPPFAKALSEQGFNITVNTPERLPSSLNQLLDFNAVILDDVPADKLSLVGMSLLETYVRDMGGGLMMIGGINSFGAGRYSKTPVEQALPVFMDIPTTVELPSLCLLLLIDRSSSMVGRIGEKSKLEGSKIAAFSAVEMLNPIDKVGVLAFDSEAEWIVPITSASEQREIADKISSIVADGGTDLKPVLETALKALRQIEAVKKHILILSDGRTKEFDVEALVSTIRKERITVSTVGVGKDTDKDVLRLIANIGNGRYYHTNDINMIPRIFVDETQIVARNVILEGEWKPDLLSSGELFQGIANKDMPAILGLDQTFPKPGADIILNTSDGPLLATWRYGLGRSIAFTSDLSGRWGRNWLRWDQFGGVAARMVRWIQKNETELDQQITIHRDGLQGTFEVDIRDKANRFVNQLDLRLNIIPPDNAKQSVPLNQIAPGKYRAGFPMETAGEYYFNIFQQLDNELVLEKSAGYGLAYSDEYSQSGTNTDLLNTLADITDGWVMSLDDNPRELFSPNQTIRSEGRALWPFLLVTAMILLILEVAVRKVSSITQDVA